MSNRTRSQPSRRAAKKAPTDIRPAIFGFDDDGNVLFFFPEEGEACRAGEFLDRRYADCADLPAKDRPLLALIPCNPGLWIDSPCEWADMEAEPNGLLAYTKEAALDLIGRATTGCLLVPMAAGTVFASVSL